MTHHRRIIIGDIQGCREELERLLALVRFDPAQDQVISVGDIINRGPDSLGACRVLRSIGALAVRGNHENHFLYSLLTHASRPTDTFGDVLKAPERDELVAWIQSLPYVIVQDDLAVVHAGIPPRVTQLQAFAAKINDAGRPDVLNERPFVVTVRYCDPSGRRPAIDYPPPPPPFRPWDELYRGDRLICFGHWARRGLVIGARAKGLDSGCVYGGKLSAYLPEEDRVVQVPARKAYYAKSE
ncbi:MAG: metallophosphoesterase [Planctomycetota bacterium]